MSGNGSRAFRSVAYDWFEAQKVAWVPEHSALVWSRFATDICPIIGDRPIDEITSPEILKVVRAIEARGALDVAKRIRQSIGAVF